MDFETILYDTQDGVATLTLNRPERHNAFTRRMAEELREAWVDSSGDGNVDTIERYAGGARVELDADTNADGRPDVLQRFEGDTVAQQDEDADFDGSVDQRFVNGQPVELDGDLEMLEPFPALECGGFRSFWNRR